MRNLALVAALGLGWGLLDQVTKYLAVAHLTTLFPEDAGLLERIRLYLGTDHLYRYATGEVEVIPGLWHHTYVQNPAGAFGLLRQVPLGVRRWLFLGVAGLAMAGILWMARRVRQPVNLVALGLVMGGAVGNMLDRALHGYVIDFVDWHYGTFHWPAFNVADVGIVVGVVALLAFLGRDPSAVPGEAPGEAGEPAADP